jgi:hypothetical protein
MTRKVRQAKNGDILIASYIGVYRYDGKSFTNITRAIEWPTFWDVLEDRKGNIWLASQDSGVYIQPAGQTGFKLLKASDGTGITSALHIYEDRSGNIWFGANRYDPSASLRTGGNHFGPLPQKMDFPLTIFVYCWKTKPASFGLVHKEKICSCMMGKHLPF